MAFLPELDDGPAVQQIVNVLWGSGAPLMTPPIDVHSTRCLIPCRGYPYFFQGQGGGRSRAGGSSGDAMAMLASLSSATSGVV